MDPLEYATEQLTYVLRHHFQHEGDAENVARAIRNLIFTTIEYERRMGAQPPTLEPSKP